MGSMFASVLAASCVCGQEQLSKVSLAAVDGKAVCTDSSPAVYYYKPSTASRMWLIYLEGGGWCYDEDSCRSRCGNASTPVETSLCSSKSYGETVSMAGIFAPAMNAELKNANKAFVKYCTSDGHMGDGAAFGFQFRGQLVVQAVLKDLVSKGLGSLGGREKVIFGGGSAGARGAMVHLDYVKVMLGAVAANVDVVGFLDSPAWIDLPSYRAAFPGFAHITQQVHSYANVQHLGRECLTMHGGMDAWKCMFGQYRLPTLNTPYFLVASQYDAYQLASQIGLLPVTAGERDYAEKFASLTRQLGLELLLSNKAGVTVYSWACYNHCVSASPPASESGFNSHTCEPNGTTMDAAFEQYLANTGLRLYQDSCGSFGCGKGCGVLLTNERSRGAADFGYR